ncbi:MAG: hypothetical protein E7667_05880 [Ruminococcaceae bacterium]|nr:hypothetical protein [Oscillospiraceae bacterium]
MNWNDIKKSVSNFADKAGKKTEEIADLATIKLKMAKLSSDREVEFSRLGKITYTKLTATDDSRDAELTEGLSRSIEKIARMETEIASLKAEYEQKKQDAEAQKKAKKANQTEFGADEINTEVLDSFSDIE